ncbi:LCP family protein [Lentzea sp. NPDC060358]|uniref:LCP family protein n=1 Tax=Lentzea sp. NPDC060358 TaxID=3347103 RepID=UPI0036478F74
MNDLIRQAVAAEAEERVDPRIVLAELQKAKKRTRPWGVIAGVAALTAAATAAAVLVPTALEKTDASPATQTAPVTAQNVLLIGIDDADRTDALVFTHFGADGSVTVISVPKDVAVGQAKINDLYRQSPQRLVDEVERMTGEEVDHYAAVRMSEFGRVSQAVGGVEVCLSAPSRDTVDGAGFPAGRQTLTGDTALAFLRQRGGLPGGELDRVRRHQAFLAGLAAKITAENAPALARELSTAITVDQGWDVLAFAQRFRGPVKISSATLPTGGSVEVETGQAVRVDPVEAQRLVEERLGTPAPADPSCVR